MTPEFINDLRDAVHANAGRPVEIEDPQTHQVYVVMTRQDFQRLVYDDSDLSPSEMLAAAGEGLSDEEGWNAPGMETYDQDDASPAKP